MPIYVYRCERCRENHEVFDRGYVPLPKIECPKCGEDAPRQITAAGIGGQTEPGMTRINRS